MLRKNLIIINARTFWDAFGCGCWGVWRDMTMFARYRSIPFAVRQELK